MAFPLIFRAWDAFLHIPNKKTLPICGGRASLVQTCALCAGDGPPSLKLRTAKGYKTRRFAPSKPWDGSSGKARNSRVLPVLNNFLQGGDTGFPLSRDFPLTRRNLATWPTHPSSSNPIASKKPFLGFLCAGDGIWTHDLLRDREAS